MKKKNNNQNEFESLGGQKSSWGGYIPLSPPPGSATGGMSNQGWIFPYINVATNKMCSGNGRTTRNTFYAHDIVLISTYIKKRFHVRFYIQDLSNERKNN